ncbi:hypothetical protein QUW03_07870 [Faecalicoccus acidiformans]|uniref:hypothetical protein n=1 Tax=Faecalicoccus acidiformans TaxID=915173 RepID=UPI0025A47D3F|nr:hypothetical protein [Faecalicoccus acidiformans]MDM8204285.1 hypothetical protein [Faecalicoccus acidiformans]
MSLKEWAEREVEIACKRENPDRKEGEFDYGCACYESALKAFNSLLEDGHSGMSIGYTKQILNRLIEGKPLTPVEDTEDTWQYGHTNTKKGCKTYQCKRMSSLFKDVYPDGTVKYHDNNRIVCAEVDSPDVYFTNQFIRRIVEETIGEITMPYMPSDRPTKVYVGECLYDKKNGGDYDTLAIYYGTDPDGNRIYINRYFKGVPNGWKEIDLAEFNSRCVGDLEDGEDL